MKLLQAALIAGAFTASAGALAHGTESHTAKPKHPISTEQKAFGREGDPAAATRTIKVDMNDTMRFNPGALQVKAGETIRFEITNSGRIQHELVLGTLDELKAHSEMMRKHPGMEHDEPYMAHVAPGKTEPIVWTFNKPGDFYYGCLVAGHFEAGMQGRITVR